jgi:hypothetical protein
LASGLAAVAPIPPASLRVVIAILVAVSVSYPTIIGDNTFRAWILLHRRKCGGLFGRVCGRLDRRLSSLAVKAEPAATIALASSFATITAVKVARLCVVIAITVAISVSHPVVSVDIAKSRHFCVRVRVRVRVSCG